MKQLVATFILGLAILGSAFCQNPASPDLSAYNLNFDYLPQKWDEGIPLGNGEIGSLMWEKEGKLRLSLDHVNLWDLRKMENLQGEPYTYAWVYQQWRDNEYKKVQDLFDAPYDKAPAPSKIPGGAMEFDTKSLGKANTSSLDIATGVSTVTWESGAKFSSYVHAEKPLGWFRLEGVDPEKFEPMLLSPAYQARELSGEQGTVSGKDVSTLGYPQGDIEKTGNQLVYRQKGFDGFEYQISISWKKTTKGIEGLWSISTSLESHAEKASERTAKAVKTSYDEDFASHQLWWDSFWNKSSIRLPDPVLQKQWYLELYKFASAARSNTPPISLQAVWTADNGKLPPWKGDFHHDLNTQLSYWPSYSANHLDMEVGYLNWLWDNIPTFKEYTQTYYQTQGINVPGVSTLTGDPMGGWIQYAFGPTVSAWLSHHFYLHWRYSMDRDFLEKKAYPWFKEVATYLDEVSVWDEKGLRKLPISASPEVHNNSREAWFSQTTNFDLANIRFVFTKAAELADELGHREESQKWKSILSEWPDFAIDASGMMLAPGAPLDQSHRHFSHLMAIHPLSLINWSDGKKAQTTIQNTVTNLKKTGSSAWVGYSFAWLGNLQARMLDGEGAAETLRIFAENFCLPNSFHVNGDQSGKGYSNFTYRPFTLEGNFAFAAGVQEMLLQSHEGFIRLFPAVPNTWVNVGFDGFLTEGAFEIQAEKITQSLIKASVKAPKGGKLRILNPFDVDCLVNGVTLTKGEIWSQELQSGQEIQLTFQK